MSSSVNVKWCGVTSKVTRALARLPRRTLLSASAVERWATCRRALGMCMASWTSRSTIEASAAVVVVRYCSGGVERTEVGERGSLAGPGRGGDGKHIDDGAAFGLTKPLDPLDRIDHWNCVGHGANG